MVYCLDNYVVIVNVKYIFIQDILVLTICTRMLFLCKKMELFI